jgi:hypothetical protein
MISTRQRKDPVSFRCRDNQAINLTVQDCALRFFGFYQPGCKFLQLIQQLLACSLRFGH